MAVLHKGRDYFPIYAGKNWGPERLSTFSEVSFLLQMMVSAGCQWLTPVILATQEAEIRRIVVQGQPKQRVCENNQYKKGLL
jgi:hypothetical protein